MFCSADKQPIASSPLQHTGMSDDTKRTVAMNLSMLMRHYDHNQQAVARKSGAAQRTISSLLDPADGPSPKLDTLARVADVYGLKAWQLQVPGQTLDVLLSQTMEKVVLSYAAADQEGRRYIEHVAEKEREYRSRDVNDADSAANGDA